jgi:HK97 family phage major capsid protein
MSMSISEAHAEIRKLYDAAAAIENKYPDGLTAEANAADYAEARRLLSEIDGLEEKLGGLEDAEARKRRILDNQKRLGQPSERHRQPDAGTAYGDDRNGLVAPSPRGIKAFGSQFVDSEEYKRIVDAGLLHNPANRVELNVKLEGSLLDAMLRKALVYSGSGVAGPTIYPDIKPGLDFLFRQTTLLDMIPTGTTTSNLIEYYEQTLSTNAAAPVAEATASTGTSGSKPEGALGWVLRTIPVSTIAEWIPITNQTLSDSPAIRGIIDSQLITHLEIALENQVLSGNGTAPNMLGILTNPAINSIGLGAGSGSAMDAVYHAMTVVMVTGLSSPSASVWNPVDFEKVRLARETPTTGGLGAYLLGPPNTSGPTTLWGRPVVQAIGMPVGTALVADFTQMMLFDREQGAVRTGLINDQFVRNMLTILAELRAAFALFRPLATCRVTGLP